MATGPLAVPASCGGLWGAVMVGLASFHRTKKEPGWTKVVGFKGGQLVVLDYCPICQATVDLSFLATGE
ncbi:MAG: hypothetical protein IVW52_20680 [Acidimicrobiales bacterium]|nr:hypothetical protein [Acidimicrobiales bacterium]